MIIFQQCVLKKKKNISAAFYIHQSDNAGNSPALHPHKGCIISSNEQRYKQQAGKEVLIDCTNMSEERKALVKI